MQEFFQKPMAPIENSQFPHPSIKAPILRFSPRQHKRVRHPSANIHFPQSSRKVEGTIIKKKNHRGFEMHTELIFSHAGLHAKVSTDNTSQSSS